MMYLYAANERNWKQTTETDETIKRYKDAEIKQLKASAA